MQSSKQSTRTDKVSGVSLVDAANDDGVEEQLLDRPTTNMASLTSSAHVRRENLFRPFENINSESLQRGFSESVLTTQTQSQAQDDSYVDRKKSRCDHVTDRKSCATGNLPTFPSHSQTTGGGSLAWLSDESEDVKVDVDSQEEKYPYANEEKYPDVREVNNLCHRDCECCARFCLSRDLPGQVEERSTTTWSQVKSRGTQKSLSAHSTGHNHIFSLRELRSRLAHDSLAESHHSSRTAVRVHHPETEVVGQNKGGNTECGDRTSQNSEDNCPGIVWRSETKRLNKCEGTEEVKKEKPEFLGESISEHRRERQAIDYNLQATANDDHVTANDSSVSDIDSFTHRNSASTSSLYKTFSPSLSVLTTDTAGDKDGGCFFEKSERTISDEEIDGFDDEFDPGKES